MSIGTNLDLFPCLLFYPFRFNPIGSIVGSEGTLVEFWQPFDDNLGGKDMACVHLNVAATMVLKVRRGICGSDPSGM